LPCHNTHCNTLSVIYPDFQNDIPSFEIDIALATTYGNQIQPGRTSKHVSLVLQPPRA
jgi:hypothetical protein